MDPNPTGVIDWGEFEAAWTVADVIQWLSSVGHSSLADTFHDNDIDGGVLMSLTDDDLLTMGIDSSPTRESIMTQVTYWSYFVFLSPIFLLCLSVPLFVLLMSVPEIGLSMV